LTRRRNRDLTRRDIVKDSDMNGLHRFAAGLALLAIANSASAQSNYTTGHRDNRMQAGIVIPFGSAGSRSERAPRLEAWSEPGRSQGRAELPRQSNRDEAYSPPTRLGVTLAGQPRMMVNGREVPGQADRHNISALGIVGIVAGVAVIVVGAAVLGAFGSFSN
jgi:hypothetical protein